MSVPSRHSLTFTYDASGRLTGITDALGQTSSLFYENAQFPNRVTKISDPFGAAGSRRSALMSYDTSGRLVSITDPEGIQSSFTVSVPPSASIHEAGRGRIL